MEEFRCNPRTVGRCMCQPSCSCRQRCDDCNCRSSQNAVSTPFLDGKQAFTILEDGTYQNKTSGKIFKEQVEERAFYYIYDSTTDHINKRESGIVMYNGMQVGAKCCNK